MTPIGTCQAERSFSVLKRIKTNLPSTMTEERLTGLTMMLADHAEYLLLQMETVARQFKLGVCFALLFCMMSQDD